MYSKIPKNTQTIQWTNHCIQKMQFYRLSEGKIKSVLFRAKRKEEGVAPKTTAHMQQSGSKKNPKEIWIMFQEKNIKGKKQFCIISAWRYPGITKPRDPVPMPEDIKEELKNL